MQDRCSQFLQSARTFGISSSRIKAWFLDPFATRKHSNFSEELRALQKCGPLATNRDWLFNLSNFGPILSKKPSSFIKTPFPNQSKARKQAAAVRTETSRYCQISSASVAGDNHLLLLPQLLISMMWPIQSEDVEESVRHEDPIQAMQTSVLSPGPHFVEVSGVSCCTLVVQREVD